MSEPSLGDSGLAGEVALVTGGSRGIGRAIVEILAAAGMEVHFTFLQNQSAAEEVLAGLPSGRVHAHALDVRDAAACAEFVEGREQVDLLVNNAGIIRDGLLAMMTEEDVRAVLQTNVEGAFNMTRAVLPQMISRRRGKIINVSSVAGEKGGRGQTNYAASKGALDAFTRALAVEVAPRGIRVNGVAPGVIETEMSQAVRELAGEEIMSRILLRRVGLAVDVAHAVWFLSSRYASYITGEILRVDGGFKME